MIETASATLKQYLSACERRDLDAIAACFAPNALIRDPLGVKRGHAEVRSYFADIYADLTELSFDLGPAAWCGDVCAFSWAGRARKRNGCSLTYRGVDVFTFDDAALIVELWAFWSPDELMGSDNLERTD